MRYAIVIERAEQNDSVCVPDLPGCVATGSTVGVVPASPFALSRCARQTDMGKTPTATSSSEAHDDAPLRRADDTAGKRVLRTRGHGAVVFLNKQRVNIFLDGAVIEHVSRRPVIAAIRPSSTRR